MEKYNGRPANLELIDIKHQSLKGAVQTEMI